MTGKDVSFMAINGIGGMNPYEMYASFQSKNAIERIPVVNKEQQQPEVSQPEAAPRQLSLNIQEIKPRQNASLENISLSLRDDFFEMKGRESDLRELDVQKAVSDLQKDEVLQQYQYFVGPSGNLPDTEDGIVFQKA